MLQSECCRKHKLTRSQYFFFLGQCQKPNSTSRAEFLGLVTAEVRGAPGPHSSQLLLSGALDHRGVSIQPTLRLWAAHGLGMQMTDARVTASAERGIQWGLVSLTALFWTSHRGKPEPIWSYSWVQSVMWQRGQSHSYPETSKCAPQHCCYWRMTVNINKYIQMIMYYSGRYGMSLSICPEGLHESLNATFTPWHPCVMRQIMHDNCVWLNRLQGHC